MNSFELDAYLAREREAVEEARHRVTDRFVSTLPSSLSEPITYAFESGGKRIRPIILVAAYQAILDMMGMADERAEDDAIYELAVAFEFIHTYSLIHDDLPSMDDDDLRRGRPTTHTVFGVPRATVAGAALIPLAGIVLTDAATRLGLDRSVITDLTNTLVRAAGAAGMVGGQWLDLEVEGRDIDLERLEGVHLRKTGALLAAPAVAGGLAAGANEDTLTALGEYGQALGLAFQIADDILDLTGDQERLGKRAGRDLTLGKVTYPALLGIDRARRRAEAEVRRAVRALSERGIASPPLIGLARHVVEREH